MGKIEINENGIPAIIVPFQIRHMGRKQTIIIDRGKSPEEMTDEPLPKAIILAHQYAQLLESGKYPTVIDLACKLKLDRSYVARTLNLVNLSPTIIRKVFSGDILETLTLTRLNQGFPDDWNEQHTDLGVSAS